jgi:6,7-dimethyl-8-ribityllumazine synthase
MSSTLTSAPRVLIVCSRFYPEIGEVLAKGAMTLLDEKGAPHETIWVPGAFEVPAAIRFAISSGKYDGYVALGCVIRGETTHYDYVCGESARGLMDLCLQHQAAIGYGILTVETMEQAWERAYTDRGNKGRDAAEACLALIKHKKALVAT